MDRDEPDAENWLSEFRPVRPEMLTSADRDAAPAEQRRPDRPGQADGYNRDRRRAEADHGWGDRAPRRDPEPR